MCGNNILLKVALGMVLALFAGCCRRPLTRPPTSLGRDTAEPSAEAEENRSEQSSKQALHAMLSVKGGRARFDGEQDPFFEALEDLVASEGLDPQDFLVYRSESVYARIDIASAHEVSSGARTYVVVQQTVQPMTIPGTSAQQLLLLSSEGELLDRVQCNINSRYGVVDTEFKPAPDEDGAQIVICFRGTRYGGKENWWHNWHTIVHAGISKTFREPETGEPNDWDTKGLCRMGIEGGRFVITFPNMREARSQ